LEPEPATRDPEFQAPAEPRLRLVELDHSPEAYLRLVANPFLGLFGYIAWLSLTIGLVGAGARSRTAILISPLVVSAMIWLLFRIPRLFQYHCLDCGATGRIAEWRRHICLASSERRRIGRPRSLRGPTPPNQVILWLWVLLALGLATIQLIR